MKAAELIPETRAGVSANAKMAIALILIAHVVLAFLYANATPYRSAGFLQYQGRTVVQDIGAPDERQHVNYVDRLVKGAGFPVLGDPNEDPYENYQAHQPPLFYLIGSAFSKVFALSDFELKSSGILLRMLNGLIGAFGVLGITLLAYWASLRADVSIAAASFAAFLPMNLALSASVSNDPLLIAICSWALAFMVRAQRYGWCWGSVLRIGLLIGLGCLTKTNAVALIAVLPVFLWFSVDPGGRRKLAIFGVATIGIAILIAMPWWLRNQSLYGDPLALGAFQRAFEGSPKASMFISEFGAYEYWTKWVGWWTLRSFIGVFGYMDVFLPIPAYVALLLVTIGFSTVGALKSKDVIGSNVILLWPLGSFLFVVLVLFVRFNMQYFQGQARYLMPALGPIALAYSLGIARCMKQKTPIAVLTTIFALIGLNIYIVTSVLPVEFGERTTLDQVQ